MIKFQVPINSSLFTLSKDLSLKGMCFIEDNRITSVIKKETEEKRDFLMFLSKTKIKEAPDYYYCSIYENTNLSEFSRILESPSFITDYIYFCNGYINFRISYHRKYNNLVSEIMPDLVQNGIDIEYVGVYRNLRDDLNNISKEVSLKSIIFKTTVPEYYLKNDKSAQIKWSRIVRGFFSQNLDSVYFIDDINEPPDIFVPIDREANIYQARTENPLLLKEEEVIEEEGMKPVAAMNYFDGNVLWIQYILMKRDVSRFISKYGEALSEFPEWNGYIYEIENLEDF
ncbi:hypothetical protein ACNF42_06865 [Cuniculiplasma sp. SKW3]|uniref:hypothetical protein n=1 Tax=Cuniculiplasma sp. SKW3 TaxID=3400170 RepID=UPI003FD2F184